MLTLTCSATAFNMIYTARGNRKTLNVRKTAATTTITTTAIKKIEKSSSKNHCKDLQKDNMTVFSMNNFPFC